MGTYASPQTTYKEILESPRLSWKTRAEALSSLKRPSLRLMTRLLRNPTTPKRLKFALAQRLEQELTNLELKKRGQKTAASKKSESE